MAAPCVRRCGDSALSPPSVLSPSWPVSGSIPIPHPFGSLQKSYEIWCQFLAVWVQFCGAAVLMCPDATCPCPRAALTDSAIIVSPELGHEVTLPGRSPAQAILFLVLLLSQLFLLPSCAPFAVHSHQAGTLFHAACKNSLPLAEVSLCPDTLATCNGSTGTQGHLPTQSPHEPGLASWVCVGTNSQR